MDEELVSVHVMNSATTGTAQSVITTTETAFEAFFADNFLFLDMDECLHWCKVMLDQEYELENWVHRVTFDDVYERLVEHFLPKKQWDRFIDLDVLKRWLSTLNQDELTKIYYKNNLTGFIANNPKVRDLYRDIFVKLDFNSIPLIDDKDNNAIPEEYKEKFSSAKDYNAYVSKLRFMDPNSVPDAIKDTMKEFASLIMKYVYDKQIQFDKIYRLKNFFRKTVVVVDTDSNMLNCGPWMDFTSEYVMESNYEKTEEENTFIAVNTAAYLMTEMVNDILLYYGEVINIPEEYRSKYNMKNEFLFKRLVVADKKKRYVAEVVLREGRLTRKLEVKGMDFIKSTATDEFEEFAKKVTRKYVVSDEIDIASLQMELMGFRDNIYQSLASGNKEHLPNASVKDISAYKFPWREESVRGAYIWNTVYPNNEIESSTKVKIAKLTATSERMIESIKDTHPDIYNTLIDKVFHSKNEAIAKNGLSVLAIPPNSDIPDWAISFIDYEVIINNILGAYASVTDALKMGSIKVGKSTSGRRTSKFSNIIKF